MSLHGTGVGNYIKAGIKTPVSSYSDPNDNYTFIEDPNAEFVLQDGYTEPHPQKSRRRSRRYDSDDDNDSSDDDDDSSDDDDNDNDDSSDSDDDDDYRRNKGTLKKLNKYAGLSGIIIIIMLAVLFWYVYHIRKDIDSMFGE